MSTELQEAWEKEIVEFNNLYDNAWVLWNYLYLVFDGRKITFPALLYKASQGIGYCIDEKFYYDLNVDFEGYPEDFKALEFYHGEQEILLPIEQYLHLIQIASDFYLEHHPEDSEDVHRNLQLR